MFSGSLVLAHVSDAQVKIGEFSSATSLDQWESKTFKGQTLYQLVTLDGTSVLRAESHHSASGLIKKQRIDLLKTPILNWRWRTENRFINSNEQVKSGDDFAARVYVVISGGFAFWRTRAINYVWASGSPTGKIWSNPFVGDRAIMIALRSSSDQTGTWYTERRNILADIRQYIDQDVDHIDAVAIMTDTDNTHSTAKAYYGDIYFTEN